MSNAQQQTLESLAQLEEAELVESPQQTPVEEKPKESTTTNKNLNYNVQIGSEAFHLPASLSEIVAHPALYEHLKSVSATIASSSFIPAHFKRGSDVMFLLCLSRNLGVDLPMVAQKAYSVHGKIGLEGQLVIAALNAKAPIKGRVKFQYEGEGDKLKCIAYAVLREDDSVVQASYSIQQAKIAKIGGKIQYDNQAMYKSDPEQKLAYDAATRLARRYFPDILMGFSTKEELEFIEAEYSVKGQAQEDFVVES